MCYVDTCLERVDRSRNLPLLLVRASMVFSAATSSSVAALLCARMKFNSSLLAVSSTCKSDNLQNPGDSSQAPWQMTCSWQTLPSVDTTVAKDACKTKKSGRADSASYDHCWKGRMPPAAFAPKVNTVHTSRACCKRL